MVWSIINKILFFIMTAFLLFSAVELMEGLENKKSLVDDMVDNPINTSKGIVKFWYGYTGITPSIMKDWLPSSIHQKEKYLFIIEDFPLPDNTDLIIITPIILLAIFILRQFDHFRKGSGILQAILITLFIIILLFLIIKIAQYEIMLQGIKELGLEQEKIISERISVNKNLKDYMPTFIIMSLFMFLSIIKVCTSSFSKKKK